MKSGRSNHFNRTGYNSVLAYDMVYTNKLNDGILTWDFAHRQVYLWVEDLENFSSQEGFLLEILKSQKAENSSIFRGICVIFRTLIWKPEFRATEFLSRTFSDGQKITGISTRPESPGQKSVARNSCNPLISREGNSLLSWNFQGLLLTNRPVCRQKLRSKYRHSIYWYIPCHRLKFQ